MSKNVRIIQNGNEKTLRKVEKIQTYLANGRICNWVPEDEYPLGILTVTGDGVFNPADDPNGPYYGYSKVHASGVGSTDFGSLAVITITKNGEYIASGESSGPYYGYSKVIVNVEKSDSGGSPVVGKDDDGDDAIPKIDEDGHIVTEKLPTRISIDIYPNNLVYEDGQAIDFTGLRVKAFLPNDTEWGVVPDNELIKPVKVAEGGGESSPDVYTPSDEITLPSDMTSLVGGNEAYAYSTHLHYWFHFTSSGGRSAVIEYNTNGSNPTVIMICASTNDAITVKRPYGSGSPEAGPDSVTQWTSDNPVQVNQTTINGRTFYYAVASLWHYQQDRQYNISVSNSTSEVLIAEDIAYILLFGNHSGGDFQQTIPLQWKRPGDGKVLETSFTIAVHDSSGGDNNTSGGNVTPGGPNIDVPQ